MSGIAHRLAERHVGQAGCALHASSGVQSSPIGHGPPAGVARQAGVIVGVILAVLLIAPTPARTDPSYVGTAVCTNCHDDAGQGWTGSDHAKAWTLPSETTVLGDFSGVTYEHGGQVTRFLRDGGTYLIETEGPDGERRAYEVVGVAGVDPLQQYLLSPEPGRVQVYDIAWDVEARRWYPVFPGPPPPPKDGFDWSGSYKSWDGRCAECHATDYSRNYDPASDSYAPRMAEIGVGCEACHGPGSDHVAWARRSDGTMTVANSAEMGLTIDLDAPPQAEIMQCLTCHSRREAMGDGNPVPGTPYHDAFSMALLREGLYHPDGTILDEVFEGGSFLQSRMHAKGVRCSTCHEPHSATLRAEGNAVCTQCHSPAGNPDFPSLALKVYDGPEHHFHPGGGEGAQCVSCHMTRRTYMGIDTRRDHSFRVPRPDLAATGSPDACTDCHQDRDAAWAAAELARRFPDSTRRGPHYASIFAAARRNPQAASRELLDLAEWRDGPAIVRATALELLGAVPDIASARRVMRLLPDADPMVRAAAAGTLRSLPAPDRLIVLQPLLTDPVRSVREAAAKALLDVRLPPGSPQARNLADARAEWEDALNLRADFPETHLQMGGAALQSRDFTAALDAFERAVALDPQLVDAWMMVIRLHAAMNDPDAAEAALGRALSANPGNVNLLALQQGG
ncbi:multiheme c-type cytochrome [Paracoccus benzoatiresistens]|uniref:Multiheme c-type cytochrome n=1 Tax=Paracoccus benzoatiresistens TaxID=2997341 RepID=A0ABT4J9U3_9RHOB|nr:multiheme c-type cytochrome [Paracoccus sp. EF6]MCZ0963853.1 multiheme c-type cytochrome [Paracoccus sp. EF6]